MSDNIIRESAPTCQRISLHDVISMRRLVVNTFNGANLNMNHVGDIK